MLAVPAPVSDSATTAAPGLIGGASAVQGGRQRISSCGSTLEVTVTTKLKAPGALFDGQADLSMNFTLRPTLGRQIRSGGATAHIGFKALVEQREARPVTDPPAYVADPDAARRGQAHASPVDPTRFTVTGPPTVPGHRTFDTGSEVPVPPDEVWATGPGGGLRDTVTVRDISNIQALHAELDTIGLRELGNDWYDIRDEVLSSYSHTLVSSRITSMTRGLPLETPKLTAALLKRGIKFSATARVTELEYKRTDDKAEFNPVAERTTFDDRRTMLQRTWAGRIQGGGITSRRKASAPVLDAVWGNYGLQIRKRSGWRSGDSGKVHANGKYARAQALFTGKVTVSLQVTRGNRLSLPSTVSLDGELSMDVRDTRSGQVGEDGLAIFQGPGSGAPRTNARPAPAQLHDAPQRITQRGAMGGSDTVLSLGADDTRLLRSIEAALTTHAGTIEDDDAMRLRQRFDPFTVKAELSRLSRGGELTETVSVNGWSGTVTVRPRLKNFTHTETVKGFEFELGSQLRGATGISRDTRTRHIFGANARFKVPHVNITGGYNRLFDSSTRLTATGVGSTSSRGKSVEAAGVFTGDADFTVHYDLSKLGRRLKIPDCNVTLHPTIAVPLRDAPQQGHAAPPVPHPIEVPTRIRATERLGSSDIVTDVYPVFPGTDQQVSLQATVNQLNHPGHRTLGSDWPGMRAKILDALDPGRLQPKLKPMMSGHQIVIDHGRSRVRISASVNAIKQKGNTAATEFTSGTSVQNSITRADDDSTAKTSQNHNTTVTALATSNPFSSGAALVGGGRGTRAWGQERLHAQTGSTTAGMTTKSKMPGSVNDGVANLIVTMERRPLLCLGGPERIVPEPAPRLHGGGTRTRAGRSAGKALRSVQRLGTSKRTVAVTRVGFESTVQASEGQPASTVRAFTAPGPGARQAMPKDPMTGPPVPVPVPVRIPPRRLWTGGMRDLDVVRWLSDSSGVQDILRSIGPAFFGKQTWKRLEGLSRSTLGHSQLSSKLGIATRGEELGTPEPGHLYGSSRAGVSGAVRLLRLEYRGTESAVELSPANETVSSTGSSRLDWAAWGGSARIGVMANAGNAEASMIFTGSVQRRESYGVARTNGGRVIASAKFNTPMARYDGYAEVTLTFRNGDRTRQESGIVPVTIDIPVQETTAGTVPSDHYLVFSPQDPQGHPTPLSRTDLVAHGPGPSCLATARLD